VTPPAQPGVITGLDSSPYGDPPDPAPLAKSASRLPPPAGNPGTIAVPEPVTGALVGVALVFMYIAAKRRGKL